MFDLDESIAHWRRELATAGIHSEPVLDELESHLRDAIDDGREQGLGESESFARAVLKMGRAGTLQEEFGKNPQLTEDNTMKRLVMIGAALTGMVLGLGLILPALDRWNRSGILPAGPLVAGLILVLGGAAVVYWGVRKDGGTGRKWIQAGLIAVGLWYAVPLFLELVNFSSTDWLRWMVCGFLAVSSALFFGRCCRLNGKSPIPH